MALHVMELEARIKRNIENLQSEFGITGLYTHAGRMLLIPAIEHALENYAGGRLLDAGAGDLLYKPLLEQHAQQYESLDVVDNPNLNYQQDIQEMDFDSCQYDTVFCRNVLEHVPDPWEAVREIFRVLKDGGHGIITVPHLAYLHNEPHDYYRFTSHALEKMATDAGFEIVEIRDVAGFFSFIGYSLATFLLGTTYHIPLIGTLLLWVNWYLQKSLVWLDGVTGNSRFFPLNYLIVVRK